MRCCDPTRTLPRWSSSTLPGEVSRWQKSGVPRTIESQFQLPVYHVTAPAAWTLGP